VIMSPISQQLIVRYHGMVDYVDTWQAMKAFVDDRSGNTIDELWVLEHPAVFTLGQAAKQEHLLGTGDIPVVQSDRGGQVTYHGPGQIVIYLMLDLKRRNMGPRSLVQAIENSIIKLLKVLGIEAGVIKGQPGVYVDGEKIASLGLRIRHGCSFHGLSFNVDMDLEPFRRINPCGIEGLEVTQLIDLGVQTGLQEIAGRLVQGLTRELEHQDKNHS